MVLQKNTFLILLSMAQGNIFSAPLIQKISNQSSFGFLVLNHSDVSSCSLQGKDIVIDAHSIYNQSFLLEFGHPGLILRPVYYLDLKTNEKISLIDDDNNFVPEKIQEAFMAWKKNVGSKKRQPAQMWFEKWVGKDLIITPHTVSIFGYLNNWSRVVVKNNNNHHHEWIKFAKGIFSKEILELDIDQTKHKGVFALVKTLHGEGGVCIEGTVERI